MDQNHIFLTQMPFVVLVFEKWIGLPQSVNGFNFSVRAKYLLLQNSVSDGPRWADIWTLTARGYTRFRYQGRGVKILRPTDEYRMKERAQITQAMVGPKPGHKEACLSPCRPSNRNPKRPHLFLILMHMHLERCKVIKALKGQFASLIYDWHDIRKGLRNTRAKSPCLRTFPTDTPRLRLFHRLLVKTNVNSVATKHLPNAGDSIYKSGHIPVY